MVCGTVNLQHERMTNWFPPRDTNADIDSVDDIHLDNRGVLHSKVTCHSSWRKRIIIRQEAK